MLVAPAASSIWKCESFGTCAEPWNIRCSKRWAKPVRPSGSLRMPTSYKTLTATTGTERSGARTTRNPLSSEKRSTGCRRVSSAPAAVTPATVTAACDPSPSRCPGGAGRTDNGSEDLDVLQHGVDHAVELG